MNALTWGKYAGVPLNKVPTGYLRWLLEHVDIQPEDRTAICRQLGVDEADYPTRAELRRLALACLRVVIDGDLSSPRRRKEFV